MKLTLDNLDGLGAVDYSAAIDRAEALTLARTLNAPSTVKGMLCLAGTTLATPVRQARIVLTNDAGAILFTGYLTTEPVAIYAGVASAGPVYRLAFSAVSDEWLLDKQAWGAEIGDQMGSGNAVVAKLLNRIDPGRLSLAGLASTRGVGVFAPRRDAAWSAHAGAVASAAYSAYSAVNGGLNLNPIASTVHTLSDGDGTLSVAALQTGAVRELANDVTVSGAMEPAAYWTELFLGDGTTTVFDLAGEPDAPGAGHAVLLDDGFSGAAFDLRTWQLADPGSHLSLGDAGLILNGGNGLDGQTTLTAWDALELGGAIVLELDSVVLSPGSAGVLGGLYTGATQQANCFAGFLVTQSGGNTMVSPMVNGLATGASVALLPGHPYRLRLHLHCPEMLRVQQSYYAGVNGVVEQYGDGVIDAPVALVFELRDLGGGSSTPVTVLYDGTVASSPAQASVVAVNSLELFGSVGAVALTRSGSAWITSTDPTTGTVSTRLAGRSTDGVDCSLTSSAAGHVTFFNGRVPAPGETITVVYRGRRRAVARLADPASIAAEAAGGGVGTARWVGKVVRPVARCSADCENAAQAILSFATNRAAAVTGSYTATNPAPDIRPGDALALTANGATTTVLVRHVAISDRGAAPESLTYRIDFANDWAEGLGLTLSEAVATDVLLPPAALPLTAGSPPSFTPPVLANLQQLSVTAWSYSALTIDAGTDPPAGGGFEVRRHDGGFGSGTGPSASGDLVLRSVLRGFSIPRTGIEETFYLRMYDGSTPPLYSRESGAIVTHLPLS